MSILIKGMEMPENCGKCRFAGVCGVHSVEEWPDMESIMFNDVIGVEGKRDPDCPLVEVPAHGRLVDADKLHDAMYHRAFETDGDTMWQSGCWVRYRAIEQTMDAAPTVIPEDEA